VGVRRLVDLLPPDRIVLGLSCAGLEDLVEVAATRVGDGLDVRRVAARVLAREREQPTVLGAGFAAPHAVLEELAGETAVLVTLARPLPIATPDDRPVRVAVLLLSGPDREARLQTLARVARLASYDLADELCAAKTPARLRAIIERVESLW
jgi:PTS system nitrogen regulatory IIA component